jgi:uncharacterized protein HemY
MRAHQARSVLARNVLGLGIFAVVTGCGASSTNSETRVHVEVGPFDGDAYLYEHAIASVPLLAVREGRVEEAEAALETARGASRRGAMRDLAFAHVVAAEGAEAADARRHRQKALRWVDRASQRNRDEDQVRELRFLRVWNAYRSGARSSGDLVASFTARFQDHSEVTRIAWMVRGELAFAREDWAGAREAFRFVMASLDHPFYSYALYRTAQAFRSAGEEEEARSRLADIRDRACRDGASDEDLTFGRRAWAELREPALAEPPPTDRPAWCPSIEPAAATGSLDLR